MSIWKWPAKAMMWLLRMRVVDHNQGNWPDKAVVAVAPHTSGRDFFYGVYARAILGEQIGFVGKASLFRGPLGWFLRSVGGVPVQRNRSSNFVQQIIDIFNKRETFRLTLAIEGTRKKVDHFKTGFYYIAKGAGVPIILVRFDFGNRQIEFSKPFWPTDDAEGDMAFIENHFDGVQGLVPENSFSKN